MLKYLIFVVLAADEATSGPDVNPMDTSFENGAMSPVKRSQSAVSRDFNTC